MVPLAPVGIYLLFKEMSDANIFLILYGTISWYFAGEEQNVRDND